jgi:hypothetical protein
MSFLSEERNAVKVEVFYDYPNVYLNGASCFSLETESFSARHDLVLEFHFGSYPQKFGRQSFEVALRLGCPALYFD